MRVLGCLLSLSLFVQGCASNYKGDPPNFKLTGPQANEEIEKFLLDEGNHFEGRGAWFEMGPKKDWYTISSLKPMIEKISPEATQTIQRANRWRMAQYVTFAAALAAAVGAASADRSLDRDRWVVGAVFLGAMGIGEGFVYDSLLSSAAYEFNRDLRKGFTPSVAVNWGF